MTREEIEELKGLAASMGLYEDKKPIKRAVILGKAINELEQEPCGDCVSREAIIEIVNHQRFGMSILAFGIIAEKVKELPSVTAQPKMGQWEWKPHPVLPYTGNWYCSECNLIGQSVYDYCPNCGCKMQEVEE